METLEEVHSNFIQNLKMVEQIVNIGTDVGDLSVEFLEDLKKSHEDMEGFYDYKRKLERVISQIQNIKDAQQLVKKYEIIRNQAIVLIVENFESFLNDCVKVMIDHYPNVIKWPDGKKNFAVEVDILRYTAVPTVGDLVLTSLKREGVNFQDLQSTLKFFEDYLRTKINLSDSDKDRVIFAQAFRNIIVHNGSTVDHRFSAQIRNTAYATKYKDKEKILLSDAEYKSILGTFQTFSDNVMSEISKRVAA